MITRTDIPQQQAYIASHKITRNIYNARQYPGQRQTGFLRYGGERIQVWRVGTVWLTKGGLAGWGLSTELRANES